MRGGKHQHAGDRTTKIAGIAAVCFTVLFALYGCGLFGSSKSARTYLYVLNGGGSVSVFLADQGVLKRMPGPFATISHPGTIAITPNGLHLYVVGRSGGSNSIGVVSAYSVGSDGLLSELQGSPFAAGINPGGAAITPNGRYLYVANVGSGRSQSGVVAFAINRDGLLAQLNKSPFLAGNYPEAVAITPDGRRLYVANAGDGGSTPGNIWAFTIRSDGSLDAFGRFAVGINVPVVDPSPMAISPDGKHLYVANAPTASSRASIWSLSIRSDGALVKSDILTLDAIPHPGELTIGPAGRYLYLTNRDSDTVSVFAVGKDGSLASRGSPVHVGTNAWPEGAGVSPDGRYLFVANSINSTISVFTIGSDGSLTELGGSPFLGRSRPQAVAVMTTNARLASPRNTQLR